MFRHFFPLATFDDPKPVATHSTIFWMLTTFYLIPTQVPLIIPRKMRIAARVYQNQFSKTYNGVKFVFLFDILWVSLRLKSIPISF